MLDDGRQIVYPDQDIIATLNQGKWRLDRANHTITSGLVVDDTTMISQSLLMKVNVPIKTGQSPSKYNEDEIVMKVDQEGHLQFVGINSLRVLANAGLDFPGSSDYRELTKGK